MKNKAFIKIPLVQTEAEILLNELDSQFLKVSLSGCIDSTGRKTRIIENQNPKWYRELFSQYHNEKNGKRSLSNVRRCRIKSTLKQIKKGVYKNTFNYIVLIDIIKSRLTEGYYLESEQLEIPPALDLNDPIFFI